VPATIFSSIALLISVSSIADILSLSSQLIVARQIPKYLPTRSTFYSTGVTDICGLSAWTVTFISLFPRFSRAGYNGRGDRVRHNRSRRPWCSKASIYASRCFGGARRADSATIVRFWPCSTMYQYFLAKYQPLGTFLQN
jgi:hypothetical protein